MRKLAVGFFAPLGLTTGVAAADLPSGKMAPADAPPAAIFTWTGYYLGGNGGWIGGRESLTLSQDGNYLRPAGVLAPPNVFGTGGLPGDRLALTHTFSRRDSGFEGGVQGGYNYQTGRWVFGVEADLQGSGLEHKIAAAFGPRISANPAFTVSPETDCVRTRLEAFGTLRGRVGFAWDRLLVYGTGGLAVGRFESTTNVGFTTAGAFPVFAGAVHVGSGGSTHAGLVGGGGVEYAFFNSWTVKAEYLYFDFGKFDYGAPLVAPAGVAPGYIWSTHRTERDQLVRIGFNYKF